MTVEACKLLLLLVVARTEDSGKAPRVVVPILVDRCKGFGKVLCVLTVCVAIVSVLRSKLQVGAGIELRLVLHVVVVVLHTAGQREPVGDVELQRSGERVAELVVGEVVALGNPIGILHRHGLATIGPELRGEVAVGIVTLEVGHSLPVGTGGEEVEGHEGIEVLSLRDHVVLLHARHHVSEVEGGLVAKHLRGVAHGEVVAVEVVVVDDASCIAGADGGIGLVLLVTRRERHGVGEVRTGAEEVGRVVARRLGELVAPAIVAAGLGLSVGVLELGQHERIRELEAAAIGDVGLASGTFLRGDQDDTIRSGGAIEGGSRRSCQGRNALDVVGIEHRRGITRLTVSAVGESVLVETRLGIHHWNTVDDVEHIVVSVDGLGTTHHHTRGTTDARCCSIDLHTGHLTIERVNEVGILHRHHSITGELLHVVGQRLGFLLDTQGGDDHLVQAVGIVGHRHHDTISGLELLILETYIRHHNRCTLGGFDCEVTVDVGNGFLTCARHGNGGSDDRFTSLVEHAAFHMILPYLLLHGRRVALNGQSCRHACRCD